MFYLQQCRREINVNKKAELPQRWPRDAPYGCPESFWESLSTPKATFVKWAFVSIDPMNLRAKFKVRIATSWVLALPIPEIIGYSKNWGSPWIRPRSPFSQIFHGLLFGWTPWMYPPNLKFVAILLTDPPMWQTDRHETDGRAGDSIYLSLANRYSIYAVAR